MAFERRSSRRLMNQINVVPYIDVMLVLLVIFMVTAPLINPGQIELPQVGQALAPATAPVEVIVRKNGALAVRDRNEPGAPRDITRGELVEWLRQKQAHNPEQAVVIAADKDARYEEVVKVLDLLQSQHVKRVGLLAKPASL
ncbi:protein TolR [Pelomicrobium sp.]|jgi:biopolymer transport protein TolR|uniref:protein TolR n=1 Tax=Pelomicrobium sp. TaxID=2815319 RepID=UPI002FDDC9CA